MIMTAAAVLIAIAQYVPKQADGVTPIVPVKTLMTFVKRENPQFDTDASHLNTNGTIDIGLFQLNNANFQRLGITASDARDPAKAIKAAAILISQDYAKCLIDFEGDAAVDCMASRYNTGTPYLGLRNGYVAKFRSASSINTPATPPTAIQTPVLDAIPIHLQTSGYR